MNLVSPKCYYCDSPKWAGNPHKYYSCGMKCNSLFQKRTDECRRREASKYAREAIQSVFSQERESIKQVIRDLAVDAISDLNKPYSESK